MIWMVGWYENYTGDKTTLTIPAEYRGFPVLRILDFTFSYGILESVVIPEGVTHIGSGAFSDNSLTSVVIPAGVTHIGDGAFSRNQLEIVVIPAGVTHIGSNAFSGNQLESVVIPAGVTTIMPWPFSHNPNLAQSGSGTVIIPQANLDIADEDWGQFPEEHDARWRLGIHEDNFRFNSGNQP